MYGELVAVHEEERPDAASVFEVVPSAVILDLPPYADPPLTLDPVNSQPATDFLKSTYQLECRSRCQQEREHFSSVCREYLLKSFDARIRKAQERVMGLRAREREAPEVALARQRTESVRIRRALRGISMPMDILVIPETRLREVADKPGLVYQEALRHGRVVYDTAWLRNAVEESLDEGDIQWRKEDK